jgi:hypothetical protein
MPDHFAALRKRFDGSIRSDLAEVGPLADAADSLWLKQISHRHGPKAGSPSKVKETLVSRQASESIQQSFVPLHQRRLLELAEELDLSLNRIAHHRIAVGQPVRDKGDAVAEVQSPRWAS